MRPTFGDDWPGPEPCRWQGRGSQSSTAPGRAGKLSRAPEQAQKASWKRQPLSKAGSCEGDLGGCKGQAERCSKCSSPQMMVLRIITQMQGRDGESPGPAP